MSSIVLAELKNPNNSLHLGLCVAAILSFWLWARMCLKQHRHLKVLMVAGSIHGLLCVAYVLLPGMGIMPGLESAWILVPCFGAMGSFVFAGAAQLIDKDIEEENSIFVRSRRRR